MTHLSEKEKGFFVLGLRWSITSSISYHCLLCNETVKEEGLIALRGMVSQPRGQNVF